MERAGRRLGRRARDGADARPPRARPAPPALPAPQRAGHRARLAGVGAGGAVHGARAAAHPPRGAADRRRQRRRADERPARRASRPTASTSSSATSSRGRSSGWSGSSASGRSARRGGVALAGRAADGRAARAAGGEARPGALCKRLLRRRPEPLRIEAPRRAARVAAQSGRRRLVPAAGGAASGCGSRSSSRGSSRAAAGTRRSPTSSAGSRRAGTSARCGSRASTSATPTPTSRRWFGPIEGPCTRPSREWDGRGRRRRHRLADGPPHAAAARRGARAYLVQDHEPEFYGTSAERTWAEQTYSLGLHCVCASPWLAERDAVAVRRDAPPRSTSACATTSTGPLDEPRARRPRDPLRPRGDARGARCRSGCWRWRRCGGGATSSLLFGESPPLATRFEQLGVLPPDGARAALRARRPSASCCR